MVVAKYNIISRENADVEGRIWVGNSAIPDCSIERLLQSIDRSGYCAAFQHVDWRRVYWAPERTVRACLCMRASEESGNRYTHQKCMKHSPFVGANYCEHHGKKQMLES